MIKKLSFSLMLLGCTMFASAQSQEGFLGEIRMFAGNFAPRGWALCDGQILAISSNTALFSILGTTYGGDGRTTFALPDMRGRVSIHAGNGPGLTPRRLGQKGGSETNTLTNAQLPSHSHTQPAGNTNPGTQVVEGNQGAITSGATSNTTINTNTSGGSQAVNNIQPFQTVYYIICLQGTFPSRS